MSYIRATEAQDVSPELMALLARLVGLNVHPDDVEPLAIAIRDQLASIDRLEALDLGGLDGVNPVGTYDPRWTETR
jgi:hypothetical protein